MDILGIAAQGLQQAQGQFDQTAQRIAQTSVNPSDSVSLSDEAVSLMSSENAYESNLAVAQTAGEMQQATLNLLA